MYCSFHTWYGFHKGKADAQQLERKVETCDQAWVSPSSRELTCNFGLFLRDLQELLKRPEGFYVQVRIFSVSCSMAEKKNKTLKDSNEFASDKAFTMYINVYILKFVFLVLPSQESVHVKLAFQFRGNICTVLKKNQIHD